MYGRTSDGTTAEPRQKCEDYPDRPGIGREDEGPLPEKTTQDNAHHSLPMERGPPTDEGKKSTTAKKQRTIAIELCK